MWVHVVPYSAGRRLFVGLIAVLLAVGGLIAGAVPASADDGPRVLLLLDVSGSMNGKISGGGTKFAAAKQSLKRVTAGLPPGTQVGLRVYGSEISEDQTKNPKACTDTRLVLPVGPLDQARMDAAVDSFSARGETPIAYAMGKAVDDLGDSGKRVLILISDGQETCAGDPCPVAAKLAKRGVDLQFNAIGLAVNAKARSQLQCIAGAGGGTYYDTNDTDSLGQALRKLTQRALRPFEVAGTPVKATPDPASAPVIGGGQYRDSYDASGTPRSYTITRTPGSLVTASASTVVRQLNGGQNSEQLHLTLTTLGGEECSAGSALAAAASAAIVYGGAVRSASSQSTRSPPQGCTDDAQLRLTMDRTSGLGAGGTVPVELVVTEQQPVLNRDALPESVSDYDGKGRAVAEAASPQPTVGGSGFSNAGLIGAGTWSDSVAFGETVLYRVHLDYGQSVRVTAVVPGGSGARLTKSMFDQWYTRVAVVSPARLTLSQDQLAGAGNKPITKLTVASPPVRVRNEELALPVTQSPYTPDASTASLAGDYYISLEIEPVASTQLKGVDMPVQLNVAVDGTPGGQPVFDQPSPTPTTGPVDDRSDDSVSSVGLIAIGIGIGIAVVLIVAGATVWLRVRRRRSRGVAPHP